MCIRDSDNVVKKENDIYIQCESIEKELPKFLRGYFAYLKGNVLPMTRLAYLHDIKFFFNYLMEETDLTRAKDLTQITAEDLNGVQAVDVNMFIDYCRKYKVETKNAVYMYENANKTLARKKSSVSVLFKYLYRDGLIEKNITDGFDPIRVPKPGEKEIKALQDLSLIHICPLKLSTRSKVSNTAFLKALSKSQLNCL